MSKEDAIWFELEKALTSQDGTGRLEVKGQELPDSPMAGFHGLTVHRPVVFSGVTFSPCESRASELLFSQVTFKQSVCFQDCSFRCKFVRFDECGFEGGLTFVNCKSMPEIVFLDSSAVRGLVTIRQCRFDRLHILPANSGRPCLFEKPVSIEDCSFNELFILRADCRHGWHISDSVFERKLAFSNCHFESWLYLDRVTVKESPPRKSGQSPDGLEVSGCTLSAGITFKQVACDGDFTLFNTTIDGPLQMIDTSLNGEVAFVSVDKGPKGECHIDKVHARLPGALEPLYRYAKVAKASRGDLDGAGQFYYLERKAHNAATRAKARWLSRPNKIWPWAGRMVGDWLLGYGEKPERPLYWALGTIMAFSLLFCWLDAGGPQASSWGEYLLFSVLAFARLGYGNMHLAAGLPLVLVAVEAILGVVLMSLFLVVLTRRFMR